MYALDSGTFATLQAAQHMLGRRGNEQAGIIMRRW